MKKRAVLLTIFLYLVVCYAANSQVANEKQLPLPAVPSLLNVQDDVQPPIKATPPPQFPALPAVPDDQAAAKKEKAPFQLPPLPTVQDDAPPVVQKKKNSFELPPLPQVADMEIHDMQFGFNGAWLPGVDPLMIGGQNFKTLKNMRYNETAIEGVSGYTKVNTTALSLAQSYTDGTWTEVDTNSRLAVSQSQVVVTSLGTNEVAYLYKDVGTDFAKTGYNHYVQFKCTGQTGAFASRAYLWALSSTIGWGPALFPLNYGPSSIAIYYNADPAGADSIIFQRYIDVGAVSGLLIIGTISVTRNIDYYATIEFDNNIGEYGRFTLRIFSDSNRTTQITGSPLKWDVENSFFIDLTPVRYLYATNSGSGIAGATWTGIISNLQFNDRIQNGAQLQSDYTTKSYVLASTPNAIYENVTSIPATGDFEPYSLYATAAGASVGRFSPYPNGNIGYANGKESCIWAGDEMPVAGFYTLDVLAESYQDVTITGGGVNRINFLAGTTLITDGYKPGMQVVIDGSLSNDNTVTCYTMTETSLTTVESLTTEAAAADITLTVVRPDKNAIDYTEAANNALQTSGNVVSVGGGIDSYAVLMAHFDGTDGSTTMTDSSASAHSYSVTAPAQLDTSIVKFGTASLFDPTGGGYVGYTDSADWNMGTGRATIDFWFTTSSPGSSGYIFSQHTDATTNYVYLYRTATQLWTACETGGVVQWNLQSDWTPNANQWYHIALIRGWGDNDNTLAVTVDGSEIGYTNLTAGADWGDYTGWFEINQFSGTGSGGLANHYDEFRVSKGIARWTSNFAPPTRAYRATTSKDWLIQTTRPIQAVKYYVSEANSDSATTSGKVWTGNGFEPLSITDGTSSGGISLAQSGSMSFSSTVGSAKPYYFKGAYFYAYLFELSAGSADIYHVTVDASFQPIVNMWDGVHRQCISFQVYENTQDSYNDFTLEVNTQSSTTTTFAAILDTMGTPDEHFVALFEEKMAGLVLNIARNYPNGAPSNARPVIDYWNGLAWTRVNSFIDTTISDPNTWITLGQSGVYFWGGINTGEQPISLFAEHGYAYSVSFTSALDSAVQVDTVYGIPEPPAVGPFKFPSMFGGRALLCNYEEGKQGNRVDYSMTNAPDAWNGADSSMDGIQSLFFGGSEALTAGIPLYNRIGSNLYSVWVGLKKSEAYLLNGSGPDDYKIYKISDKIGCPAPLTLTSTDTGFQADANTSRNIAIWLSFFGPVMYDGSTLYRIKGIENYFDPAKSEYINTSLIANSRGWYDQKYDEYNIVIPSGSAATSNNKWLAWNRKHNKWFEKVPYSDYPQAGWPVYDVNGFQYIYAGIDSGYMLRLEATTLWNDQPINHFWESGDFFLSPSMWDVTNMLWYKIIAETTAETVSCAITCYTQGATSNGYPLSSVTMSGSSGRLISNKQPLNLTADAYRFSYSVTAGAGAGALEHAIKPFLWGTRYGIIRKDIH